MTARFRPEIHVLVSLLMIQGVACVQNIIVGLNNGDMHAFNVHNTREDNLEIGSYGVFSSNDSVGVLSWNPVSKTYLAMYSGRRNVLEMTLRMIDGKPDSFIVQSTPIRISMGYGQLSVDYLRGNVYWTDPGLQMIMMKSLLHNGTDYTRTVLEGIDGLSGLVCYPEQEKLFWIQISYGQPVIMTSDLNGENINFFIDYGIINPLDLDVDIEEEKLYWVESSRNTLNYVQLYGNYTRGIIPTGNFESLSGLAVLSMGRIVVYNSKEVRIVSYEDEVAKSQLVLRLNHTITALTVRPDRNTTLSDKCLNLKCEQFCMVRSSVTQCGCKEGSLLSNMGDRCFDDHDFLYNVLFLLINKRLCYVSTRFIIGEQAEPNCIDTLETVVDIALDVGQRKIFLILAGNISSIIAYDIIREQITTIFETNEEKEITAIAFDGIERILYWAFAGALYRFSVEDQKIAIIIENTKRISDLEIGTRQKRLYWLNADDFTIETSTLDGHGIQSLVTAIDAKHLVLSDKNERIYWTTGERIVSVNLQGSDIQISQVFSHRIGIISIFKSIIFWFSLENGTHSSRINYSSLEDTGKIFQSAKINGTISEAAFFDDSLQNSNIKVSPKHNCSETTSIDRCKGTPMEGFACCMETLKDNFLLFSDPFSSFTYQIGMDTLNVSVIPTNSTVLHLKLDPDTQSIVFTCQNRSIMIFSITNESTEVYFFENLKPTHAIMDKTDEILFIAANATSSNLYRLVHGTEIVFREKYEDVLDIVLHKKKRLFYASIGDTSPSIRILKLLTSEETVVPFAFQMKPAGMAIDEKDDHLYFIDTEKEFILRAGLNGEFLTVFYEDKGAMLRDIGIAGEFLYSLAINRRSIAKINKKGQLTEELKFPLIIGNVHDFEVFVNGKVTTTTEAPKSTEETKNSSDGETKDSLEGNYWGKVSLGLAVGFPLLIVTVFPIILVKVWRRKVKVNDSPQRKFK